MGPCMKKNHGMKSSQKAVTCPHMKIRPSDFDMIHACIHVETGDFFTLLVTYIVLIPMFQLVCMRKQMHISFGLSAQFYILLIPIHWSNGF